MIKALEVQNKALTEQIFALQASNIINQQYMKKAHVQLDHKEKKATWKKRGEDNGVLKFGGGDAQLVMRDEFIEHRQAVLKERRKAEQEKEDRARQNKLWEAQKVKWEVEEEKYQEKVDRIEMKYKQELDVWKRAKEAAKKQGKRCSIKKPTKGELPPKVVRTMKKAFLASLLQFGEEEEEEEEEKEELSAPVDGTSGSGSEEEDD
ncbi:hypothetical protein BJ165DRAFT_1337303 [Panaeolus papilionaceus]|nr:hypothetical protein BJ165DRAFT_1337303 [Panaeolus papilionaceus]